MMGEGREFIHLFHPSLFERLASLKVEDVCRRTGAEFDPKERAYFVRFLRDTYRIDPWGQSFRPSASAELQVGIISYLISAQDIPLASRWVKMEELKGGNLFASSHPFPIDPLIKRYGFDPDAFLQRGISLGGLPQSFGDAGLRFLALPRIPIAFVLWKGDEEFPPRLSVLFDATADRHLSLDALYGLVIEICHRMSS